MNSNTIHPNVAAFLSILKSADAVRIDGSPLLSSWQQEVANGNSANEVVRFSWVDDESLMYSVILTEEGIENGQWQAHETFHCEDHEGDGIVLDIFSLKRMAPGRAVSAGDTSAAKLGQVRAANEELRSALSEVLASLDGLGVDIAIEAVHGDNADWVTRARYVAEVALGKRQAYPDLGLVGEWVGLHYHRNFDAEPAEKRVEWIERYMESHQ